MMNIRRLSKATRDYLHGFGMALDPLPPKRDKLDSKRSFCDDLREMRRDHVRVLLSLRPTLLELRQEIGGHDRSSRNSEKFASKSAAE
jgi:hypothetical protein